LRVAGRSASRLLLARAESWVSISSAWRGSKSPRRAAACHVPLEITPFANRELPLL